MVYIQRSFQDGYNAKDLLSTIYGDNGKSDRQ